eukprot:s1588_g7.t1
MVASGRRWTKEVIGRWRATLVAVLTRGYMPSSRETFQMLRSTRNEQRLESRSTFSNCMALLAPLRHEAEKC